MDRHQNIFLFSILAAAISGTTFAAENKIDPANFDKNSDGEISKTEFRAMILPAVSEEYRERDRNHDGFLDWVTLPNNESHQDFLAAMRDYQPLAPCDYFLKTSAKHELAVTYKSTCDKYGELPEKAKSEGKFPMSYTEALQYIIPDTKSDSPPPDFYKKIRLRKSFEIPVKELKKSESATISFTDNREADNKIVSLSGALFYGKNLEPAIMASEVEQGYYGGVQFNRINSKNEKGDINNLDFKLGSQWSWVTTNDNCDPKEDRTCYIEHSFTADFTKNTDFNFDRNIDTISINYSPVFSKLTGNTLISSSHIEMIFDVNSKLSVSDVKNPGNTTEIESKRSYKYWGYQSAFTFYFKLDPDAKNSTINLIVSHDWTKELNDDHETMEKSQASLHIPIAGNENLAVVATYTKGENAITREELNITEIGFGFKF